MFNSHKQQYISFNGGDSGKIIVYLYGNVDLFPTLDSGKNIINIEPLISGLQISYRVNTNLKAPKAPILEVQEPKKIKPIFRIKNLIEYNYKIPLLRGKSLIRYQISPNINFSYIVPNFDNIQFIKENSYIEISAIDATFLFPNKDYYIRVRQKNKNIWSKWSCPLRFYVDKPESIKNITLLKCDENKIKIQWDYTFHNTQNTKFLIFGSNSKDFVPEIFYKKRCDLIRNEKLFKSSITTNLIAICSNTFCVVSDKFSYFRIIVKEKESISVPSDLIYRSYSEDELFVIPINEVRSFAFSKGLSKNVLQCFHIMQNKEDIYISKRIFTKDKSNQKKIYAILCYSSIKI